MINSFGMHYYFDVVYAAKGAVYNMMMITRTNELERGEQRTLMYSILTRVFIFFTKKRTNFFVRKQKKNK